MRLFVDQIKDPGLLLEGEEPLDELARHFARLMGEEVVFLEPLRYRVRARKAAAIVEVEGDLSSACELACGRCLKPYAQRLDVDFAVAFAPEGHFAADAEEDEGRELGADELGLTIYHDEEIDLRETLYEQVIMALPQQPLCDEACRGLCPRCGIDLNSGTCDCSPEPFNNKFAALKALKSGE